MSYVIDDVAQHLHNNSVGSLGVSLFKTYMPEGPDSIAPCIVVKDTGGMEPDKDLPLKSPTFQIIIRDVSYTAGKAKLDSVRTLLHQKVNTTLVSGGVYFFYILAMSEGGHLGRDENGRDMFSINFRTETR